MVSIFRTDIINVTPNALKTNATISQTPKVKIRHEYSEDKRWRVEYSDGGLQIVNCDRHALDYETNVPTVINKVHFAPSGEYLFAIIRGFDSGILLFRCELEHWRFVDELKGIPNQGIMNRRLNRVVLNEHEITFIYNSRIRIYDLRGGNLIKNQSVRNAKMSKCEGIDVTRWFV